MPDQYSYDRQNQEIEDFQKAELKELVVLMPQDDLSRIMTLLSDKTITREALCECGDILITNMRSYC